MPKQKQEKNSKSSMIVWEEGYEDKLAKRFEEEKAKMKLNQNLEENFEFNWKKFGLILIIWILAYRQFIKWELGIM